MIPAITVCVGAVVRREDRVVWVRQTYGEQLAGVWTLPWGYVDGIDPNHQLEPPHLAALREVLEEGGITAEIEGLLGLQTHAAPDGDLRLYLLYLCQHRSGDPTPDGHETDRAAYFSLDDLIALPDPIDDFCAWLVRRVLRGECHLIAPNLDNPYAPHAAFL